MTPPQQWPLAAQSLLALAAGGLCVLAFAPFGLAPLALLAPALLFLLWADASPRQGFVTGYAFGLGLMGFGVFWVRVSVAKFGGLGPSLAVVSALGLAAMMAVYYGLVGWLAGRLRLSRAWRLLVWIPALWLFAEWLRGWLFTGFPWLALGYSQIDAPLGGWAPVFGVYGVSATVLVCAGLLAWMATRHCGRRHLAVAGLALLWLAGAGLKALDWSRPVGSPLRVAIVQGNIPQEIKWQPAQRAPTLELYQALSFREPADLILWPETAVPAYADQVEERLLKPLDAVLRERGQALMLGIPVRETETRYFNSMLVLGGRERGRYDKRHLVPFGEYPPLETITQPLLDLFHIPMSHFTPGEADRPLLDFGGHPTGIGICYEDAFGAELREALPEAELLVNASNDAWFGDSLAPHQHLEIARMRALESARYLLRATNTGVSAVVGPKGELISTLGLFERGVLRADIQPMSGATPFVVWGNWAVLVLALFGLSGAWLVQRPRD